MKYSLEHLMKEALEKNKYLFKKTSGVYKDSLSEYNTRYSAEPISWNSEKSQYFKILNSGDYELFFHAIHGQRFLLASILEDLVNSQDFHHIEGIRLASKEDPDMKELFKDFNRETGFDRQWKSEATRNALKALFSMYQKDRRDYFDPSVSFDYIEQLGEFLNLYKLRKESEETPFDNLNLGRLMTVYLDDPSLNKFLEEFYTGRFKSGILYDLRSAWHEMYQTLTDSSEILSYE